MDTSPDPFSVDSGAEKGLGGAEGGNCGAFGGVNRAGPVAGSHGRAQSLICGKDPIEVFRGVP